jgi:uncharacterized protein
LVLDTSYYFRAFEIIRERKPKQLEIRHNFQTNGVLINQVWADFFRDNEITVGLSIDGPKILHDAHRRTRTGRGTFDRVIRGVRILSENNIPFHVITVLTRESLRSARELFDFYLEMGIRNVGFNVEEIEGNHRSSSLQDVHVDAETRAFFDKIYDLCESQPGTLSVREIGSAFHAIVNPESQKYGNPLTEPLRMLTVSVDGDLSTFSPELLGYESDRYGSFVFGNIHQNELSSLLDDAKFKFVNAEIERGLAQCKSGCEYFDLCRGGAPVNKFFENGSFDSTETLFCRLTKKAVIDVVLARLEASIKAA